MNIFEFGLLSSLGLHCMLVYEGPLSLDHRSPWLAAAPTTPSLIELYDVFHAVVRVVGRW